MTKLFDFKQVFTNIPELLLKLPVTLELAFLAMIIGLVLGLILAIIKIKQIPVLKQIAGLFVSIVRGTPVLVQLYIVYFGVCSLSELLTKKPQKNEIKKDTPGYGGKPRKYWGYGGFIKRKISCL